MYRASAFAELPLRSTGKVKLFSMWMRSRGFLLPPVSLKTRVLYPGTVGNTVGLAVPILAMEWGVASVEMTWGSADLSKHSAARLRVWL